MERPDRTPTRTSRRSSLGNTPPTADPANEVVNGDPVETESILPDKDPVIEAHIETVEKDTSLSVKAESNTARADDIPAADPPPTMKVSYYQS